MMQKTSQLLLHDEDNWENLNVHHLLLLQWYIRSQDATDPLA